MKKRVISVFYALIASILFSTSALAGGSVSLSGVRFTLGSLVADGIVKGLGNTDVKVILEASGEPEIICTNQGSNPAPGQNPPNVSAAGAQNLQDRTKNGKSEFDVRAMPPDTLPGSQGGCQNDNWTAHIVFVYWDYATITVTNMAGDVLLIQNYTCQTKHNPDSITCTPK